MAEFALIAPMVFLLLLSIVVVGIVVTNYIQLTNVARSGARMAAICAGETSGGTIPDGSSPPLSCSVGDLEIYMQRQLTSIPSGSVKPSIQVCPAGSTTCSSTPLGSTQLLPTSCNDGELIQVQMSYNQPLYLPMVANIFETSSNGTRQLQASAQAGCE